MLRVGELLSKSFIDFPWLLYYERLYIFVYGKFKTKIGDLSLFKTYFRFQGCIILMPMEIPSLISLSLCSAKFSRLGVKVVPLFLFFQK